MDANTQPSPLLNAALKGFLSAKNEGTAEEGMPQGFLPPQQQQSGSNPEQQQQQRQHNLDQDNVRGGGGAGEGDEDLLAEPEADRLSASAGADVDIARTNNGTASVSTAGIANGRLGGGLPPRPPKVHTRNVSWGVAGESSLNSAGVSYSSNRRFAAQTQTNKALSVLDLMNESPYESEAEAYIMRTLDRVDPTRPGAMSEAQQTILPQVPPDAPSERFNEQDPQQQQQQQAETPTSAFGTGVSGSMGHGGSASMRSNFSSTPVGASVAGSVFSKSANTHKMASALSAKAKQHKKTKSTAEDLFALTRDMQRMHLEETGSGRSGTLTSSTSESAPTGGPRNDASILARNAATLMKRYKKDKSTKEQDSDLKEGETAGGPEESKVSAADRWKKLKTTVRTADAMHVNKKTDEPVIEEGKEDDETSEHSEGEGQYWKMFKQAKKEASNEVTEFKDWLKYKKPSFVRYCKIVIFGMIIPLIIIAIILFYGVGNPPCGTSSQCLLNNHNITRNATTKITSESLLEILVTTSSSWWVLFAVRQIITFSMSKINEIIVVEYFALRSRWCVKIFGPYATLFLVQAKGWPIILFLWGLTNFIMLYGKHQFSRQWLFYQDVIWMCNSRNPAGHVVESSEYRLLLIMMVVISFVVAFKRFYVGLHLGRQTFVRYAEDLAKVMKKAILIGKVANLAREIEQRTLETYNAKVNNELFDFEDSANISGQDADPKEMNAQAAMLANLGRSSEFKVKIIQLLGEWEEPEDQNAKDESATISAIIQFRQSLSYLNTAFPFSLAFGPAATRTQCVESAQEVYDRLLLKTPNANNLHFNTIALLAVGEDGDIDYDLVKDLIRLFRPDRDGHLNVVDFAKSIDTAYKEMRLLRASVGNSSKMDRAFGTIINIGFYFVVICFVASIIGIDPMVLFASVSSFFVGFAFMIGAACSKYFEGLLLILVRRPYDIGDRINVSDVNNDTPGTGSPGWIVKDVTLFTTTVIYGSTNEVATYSNGSLAASRIINAARSPKAIIWFLFKFPIATRYERIMVFKKAIEQFVVNRPREWAAFFAFRATTVEASLGYVEYICVAQHRESWQNIGAVMTSKADLNSFALELMKKMDMRYTAPPMPVDLTVQQGGGINIPGMTVPGGVEYTQQTQGDRGGARSVNDDNSVDVAAVAALFNSNT